MKKLFLLIMLSPLFVHSQDIPKNANTIIIKGVSFEQVVNNLLDSGFKIDKIDKEYHTVKTEYRKVCTDCVPELYLDVRVKDSIATITGKWKSTANLFFPATTNENAYIFEIKNERDKVPKRCFAIMNNFAKALNSQISYSKL